MRKVLWWARARRKWHNLWGDKLEKSRIFGQLFQAKAGQPFQANPGQLFQANPGQPFQARAGEFENEKIDMASS